MPIIKGDTQMLARNLWITFVAVALIGPFSSSAFGQFSDAVLRANGIDPGGKNKSTDKKEPESKPSDPGAQPQPGEEEELELDTSGSYLDAVQKEKLARIQVMVTKLYGHQQVPDEAKQEVRDTIFAALNGSYEPDRTKLDKISNDIMDHLKEKRLSSLASYSILEHAAEVFGADNISRDRFENFQREVQRRTGSSRLGTERSEQLLASLKDLIRTAHRNEAKIEQRQVARAEEAKKLEEERLAKEEEERRREERKSRAKSRSSSKNTNKTN
jgi:hypothetical protein